MKKITLSIVLIYSFTFAFAQVVLFEQLEDVENPNPSGIISGLLADSGLGTYSTDDFVLDDSYIIQEITAPGFGSNGVDVSTIMTGLDVYIYADNAGMPSSDPSATGTGFLEIINLSPTSTALTITDNNFAINITEALGSDLVLSAGTYWLVVAARVPDGAQRWNWLQSVAGGNSQIFDEGNFGAAFDWTLLTDLGVTFDSLAFAISGSPSLSVAESNLNAVKVFPNPVKDVVTIDASNSMDISKLELFSVTGQLVFKGESTNTIEMSNFNSGVYMLRISNDSGSVTRRIVKE